MKAYVLILLSALSATGCVTEFHGQPHVDRAYCESYCTKNKLEFSGMVALGEYSSGCICQVKGVKSASDHVIGAGGVAAAVISVKRLREQLTVNAAVMH